MTKPTILVTGSTGKTGFQVARILLEKGYPVRAMARKKYEKTEELEALGAEIVIADFLDIASIENALDGVERAYFSYPPEDRLLGASVIFMLAAEEKGVKAVVNMSQMPVRKYHPSPLSNQHWMGEQVFNHSTLTVTHIAPGFFAEMLYLMNGANILQEGKMYLPHGDALHAPIAAEDIGRSVVAILENPQAHDRQRYFLSGPERLSQKDIAAIASEVLGTPIEYVPVSGEQWAQSMKATGLFNDFVIRHLVEVGKDYTNGVFDMVTPTVKELTGQEPMDMKIFIEKNRAFFTPEFLQGLASKMAAEKQEVLVFQPKNAE